MEKKTKQKRGGSGVGDTVKMTWNMGSVNRDVRPCGETKKRQIEINLILCA